MQRFIDFLASLLEGHPRLERLVSAVLRALFKTVFSVDGASILDLAPFEETATA